MCQSCFNHQEFYKDNAIQLTHMCFIILDHAPGFVQDPDPVPGPKEGGPYRDLPGDLIPQGDLDLLLLDEVTHLDAIPQEDPGLLGTHQGDIILLDVRIPLVDLGQGHGLGHILGHQ